MWHAYMVAFQKGGDICSRRPGSTQAIRPTRIISTVARDPVGGPGRVATVQKLFWDKGASISTLL